MACAACADPVAPFDEDLAVATPGDTLFSAVVSGDYHSCALTIGGRAFCWGAAGQGQLGIESMPSDCAGEVAPSTFLCVNEPTPVAGGLRFARIAAGGVATCGITPSGRLYCWGGVPYDIPNSSTPYQMGGTTRFSDVDVRDFICAIGTDANTYCWGHYNTWGQLGIPFGTTVALEDARPVAGGHAFTSIRALRDHGCGTTAAGALYCWGGFEDTAVFDPDGGRFADCAVGRSHTQCSYVPVRMRGTDLWSRRAALRASCAITTSGGASCWGSVLQTWGGAPFGRTESPADLQSEQRPIPLALPTPVRDLVAGPYQYGACAHAIDGRVLCWGTSVSGQFGTGVEQESFTVPTVVVGGRSFVQLSSGWLFMCGLTASGAIECWGDAARGVLGTGAVVPVNAQGWHPAPTPTRVASIANK